MASRRSAGLVLIAVVAVRERQQAVIALIDLASVVAVACVAWAATYLVRRRSLPTVGAVAVALCAAFAVALVVVEPVEQLNNRRTGWLGESR